MRRWHATLAVLGVGLLPWLSATGQDVTASTPTSTESARASEELLARPTTVDVTHVSLSRAIDAAATSARVLVQYRSQVIDAYTTPVTLHVSNVPLRTVLERLLAGTTLRVIPDGATRLTIVEGAPRSAADAEDGKIVGVVTDAATKHPLEGATVTIDSGRTVRTRETGRFVFAGVPVGTHRLSVRLLGYRVASMPVTVRDGATETVNIALEASATVLNDVVTTATGDRRRLEVGNAVGTIKADSIVQTSLIRNVSDLLQSRVPGVVVSNTDGAVGAPSKIRLRGVNSVALNNDPIIILDGVRLNAQSTAASLQTNTGSATMLGQIATIPNTTVTQPLAPSRLDDIDPNTIESIDVLRGPSASSLYGTDAANGVIVIKTKKGHAGSWRTSLLGDIGTSDIPGKMPEMWWGWGHINPNGISASCNLAVGGFAAMTGGGCTQDSVTQFNPQNNPAMKTLGSGNAQTLSGNISGGNETLQQFFSGRYANNVGMSKMSDAERRLIARYWSSPAPSWMVRPNTEQDYDGSSRTTFNPSPTSDVSFTANGIYRNVLNSGSGTLSLGGVGYGTGPGDTLTYLPSEAQRTQVTSGERRGAASTGANYRPWSWASVSGTLGGDYGQRVDESNLRAQDCSVALQVIYALTTGCPSGHNVSRGETFVTTANISGQLSFTPMSWLSLRTAFGEQYNHTNFYNLQVGNSDPINCPLAFGSTLLSPAPVCATGGTQAYTVAESRDEAATAGVYVQETVTLFGIYSTFGVRHDVASAFGGVVNKSPPNYPKLDFSYPLSEKSFFPKQPYVTSLRLRLAYGQSGNQASKTAVLNSYSRSPVTIGTSTGSVNSVLVTQLGNFALRPEKGTEWEGGADVSFLDDERIHMEFTLYHKFTRDAITTLQLAPSYGVDNLSQFFNLGNVDNRGVELGVTAKLLDLRPFSWDLTVNFSHNTNKLVHKSPTLNVNGPLGTQFVEGYPLYGYWGLPVVSYADANGDHIIQPTEIKFGTTTFLGAPYPKAELSYLSTMSLWNGAVRLAANLSQVNGQTTPLLIGYGANRGNFWPRAAVDRTAPLGQQAGYIQAYVNNGMYITTTSSVRLNELSVTYTVPGAMTRRLLRAQSLSLTLAGRNLGLWSSYAGKDPNVDTSGLFGEATQDNALGTPQPRNLALRFNLGL